MLGGPRHAAHSTSQLNTPGSDPPPPGEPRESPSRSHGLDSNAGFASLLARWGNFVILQSQNNTGTVPLVWCEGRQERCLHVVHEGRGQRAGLGPLAWWLTCRAGGATPVLGHLVAHSSFLRTHPVGASTGGFMATRVGDPG